MDLDLLHQVLCLLAILEPGAQEGVLPFCLQVVDPVQHSACAQSLYEVGQRQQAYNVCWPVAWGGFQSLTLGEHYTACSCDGR